jgi:hypothetical protein
MVSLSAKNWLAGKTILAQLRGMSMLYFFLIKVTFLEAE